MGKRTSAQKIMASCIDFECMNFKYSMHFSSHKHFKWEWKRVIIQQFVGSSFLLPTIGPKFLRCEKIEARRSVKKGHWYQTEPLAQASARSEITFTLELLPEDHQEPDSALLSTLEQDIIGALRLDGYTVQLIVTHGQKGLEQFLLQIGIWLEQLPSDIWAQKDALDVVNALCGIFGTIIPALNHLLSAYKKRMAKSGTAASPIKITVEIDGDPITVEAADLAQAEAALQLAQRFHARYPEKAAKVTPQSQVKVKGRVPRSQPRRRR